MKKTQDTASGTPLSDVQKRALMAAYASGVSMVEDNDPGFGFKKATVDALKAAGLIEPDPDDDEGGYRATAAGRAALGIRLEPRPRGLKAAIRLSLRTIFPESIADEIEFARGDRLRKGSTLTLYVPTMRYNDFDAEVHWAAVATMIDELGWPVDVDTGTRNSTVLVTWLDE